MDGRDLGEAIGKTIGCLFFVAGFLFLLVVGLSITVVCLLMR